MELSDQTNQSTSKQALLGQLSIATKIAVQERTRRSHFIKPRRTMTNQTSRQTEQHICSQRNEYEQQAAAAEMQQQPSRWAIHQQQIEIAA